MSEECKAQITEHGIKIAVLGEQVDEIRDRTKELHAEKVDRREFAPVKWLGMTAGGGMILLLIGALGNLILKP